MLPLHHHPLATERLGRLLAALDACGIVEAEIRDETEADAFMVVCPEDAPLPHFGLSGKYCG